MNFELHMHCIFLESGSKSRADLDGRVSRSKPLTSPVLQGPTKPGGRGTSTSKYIHVQSLINSASHSLVPFKMQPCRCDTSEDELKEWEEFSSDISSTSRTC